MVSNTTTRLAEAGADGRGASGSSAILPQRLGRYRDRIEITARDGMRRLRDQTAVAASTGRAQVERAQDYVAYNARRRPLLATALAASSGVLLGVLLRIGARRRRAS